MRINIFIFFTLLITFFHSFAQSAVEPEACILNILRSKSIGSGSDTGVIRHNCIRQYYKDTESKSTVVNKKLLSQVTLQWYPKVDTVGYPYFLNESVRVNVKNNSNSRLIYIMIKITNNLTSTVETYKLFADNIVEPYTVGFFIANVISDSDFIASSEFFKIYSWDLISVHGLSK
jgi:hypothetical protein